MRDDKYNVYIEKSDNYDDIIKYNVFTVESRFNNITANSISSRL